MRLLPPNKKSLFKQRGIAILLIVFIISLGAVSYLVASLNANSAKVERDQQTNKALAEAKAAIISWSATNNTPGRLPCPEDTTLIGLATEGTSKNNCDSVDTRIGRLPWRTLGLSDIRDGNGDKLWYVISNGFRTGITNSDTPAQLTVDGVANSAVAIIFSPGTPNNGARPPPTNVNAPDITLYLDQSNNDGDDSFITNGAANNFNDKAMLITHQELFSQVEKRVAGEVLRCLNDYALNTGGGTFPWPAPLNPGAAPSYVGAVNTLFGRLPNSPMGGIWSATCYIPAGGGGWWLNWKELVFYGIADEYKPPGPVAPCVVCLTINTNQANPNKSVVVIVAGQALAGQNRGTNAEKGTLGNYLEAENNNGDTLFVQQLTTNVFNDTVLYQ